MPSDHHSPTPPPPAPLGKILLSFSLLTQSFPYFRDVMSKGTWGGRRIFSRGLEIKALFSPPSPCWLPQEKGKIWGSLWQSQTVSSWGKWKLRAELKGELNMEIVPLTSSPEAEMGENGRGTQGSQGTTWRWCMKGKVRIDPEVLLAESQSSWFSFFLAIIWPTSGHLNCGHLIVDPLLGESPRWKYLTGL